MTDVKESRLFSLAVIFMVYAAAVFVGLMAFFAVSSFEIITRLFIADVTATLLVWAAGMILKNSSVYDPYWSVAPAVIVPLTAIYLKSVNIGTLLLIAVILLWGVRLTGNWAVTFKSLNEQDWRYTKLKQEHSELWLFVNLFGIHIFPTIVVFLVMVPAFEFIMAFQKLNIYTVICAGVSVCAVALQLLSDVQMHGFKRRYGNSNRVNNMGTWKYIRHPNYLGEILMWWGIYGMSLSVNPFHAVSILGPFLNTIMFITISIPLMENRQLQNKPDYSEYKEKTGMLLPKLF